MSEFEDLMASGLDQALAVVGTTPFTVVGRSETFVGSYDQFQSGDEIEIGGRVVMISGQLICQIAQFSGNIPKHGRTIQINGHKAMIGAVQSDESSVTFTLGSLDQ